MLHRGPFHEAAQVPDGEHQVRPGVHEVPQAADEPPVLRRIHLLRRALTAELQLLFYQCGGWVTVLHLPQLEDALRVVSLAEGDALGILMHLDAKVEAEEAEVTHLELIVERVVEQRPRSPRLLPRPRRDDPHGCRDRWPCRRSSASSRSCS